MNADNKAHHCPKPQNRIAGKPVGPTDSGEMKESAAQQFSDALEIAEGAAIVRSRQGRDRLLEGFRKRKLVNQLKQSN